MRTFKRPRFWIALLLGFGAAAFAWTLPPQPSVTLLSSDFFYSDPIGDAISIFELENHVQIRALSNDGRFVVTRHAVPIRQAEIIAIWDAQRDRRLPIWNFESKRRSHQLILSPDQKTLCYIDGSPAQDELLPDGRMGRVIKPRSITLYDLASGAKLREFHSTASEVMFAPEGQLVSIESGLMIELKSGRELKRLPATIDDVKYTRSQGDFALYASHDDRPAAVRVYSWTSGKEVASTKLPFFEFVTQVCGDGSVICWAMRGWNNIGLREPYPEIIFDVTTSKERPFAQPPGVGSFVRASPDGEVVAFLDRVPPRPKWLSWLPARASEKQMRFLRWRTEEELAVMPQALQVCFSADSNVVGVAREDHDIEIYHLPFRKSWTMIVAAAMGTLMLTWAAAWTWQRWRSRRVTSASPDTPPR